MLIMPANKPQIFLQININNEHPIYISLIVEHLLQEHTSIHPTIAMNMSQNCMSDVYTSKVHIQNQSLHTQMQAIIALKEHHYL